MMTLLLSVVTLAISVHFAGAWTQQYSDAASTNYVDYQGPAYSGWNFTTEPFVSQTSPSITEEGIMFYPLRAYVIALRPTGTVLWKTGVAPNGEAYLTNTVYSKEHDFVVVGSSWVDQDTFFQVVAVHASNGSIAWKSIQNDLYHTTTISISSSADAVYAAGYDKSTFSGLRLSDGSLLWKKQNIYQVGIFMQTKVGPLVSGKRLSPEAVLLPTDPFNGFEGKGRLYSYEADKPGTVLWNSDLGFSAGGLFAFSSQGMIFGCDGGGGGVGGQEIFGVFSENGSVVFNGPGYCEGGRSVSGPAVDSEGYAYYSCGNQIFSVYINGTLRWKSQPLGNSTLNSINSPSIHPNGYIYFIHNNHTKVAVLSASSGSLIEVYDIINLGYFEPPILLGRQFMYLIGFQGSAVVIYPVKLRIIV